MWNKVGIVGAGLIKFGELFDQSYEQMAAGAMTAAIASVDKGIDKSALEAMVLATQRGTLWGQEGIGGNTVPQAVGLNGLPCTRVENACPSGSDAMRIGAMMVASGVHDIVCVIGVEKMRDKSSDEGLLARAASGHPIYTRGESAPVLFAPFATRHMHEFGTTREMLAAVAVKNHHNGAMDPYAHFQNEVTIDQVLASPPVCHPLHLLDCCPQTDGAAAMILVPAARAKEFTDKPVYVGGFGTATDTPYLHEKTSYVGLPATTLAAKRAYEMAGVGPDDIDMCEVHDCFTITEILDIEDLGFCEKGKGGYLTLDGETAIGGRIPVNTSGGLLAKGHPIGASGVAAQTECWWQLRGEAGDRQVDMKRGNALQHNVGGRGSGVSVVTILTSNK
ncbi:MAG: thiolase domain-containing protein [Actinomycetes bacterium]